MPDDDAISWNGERANVGALAAAAWRAGFVALEEYTNPKKTQKKTHRGRADLWLGSTHSSEYAEAKFCWLRAPETQHGTRRVASALGVACANARSSRISEANAVRVGLVFAAVIVPTLRRKNLRDDVRECVRLITEIPHDALAWCFSTVAEDLTEDGFLHPGVMLLARIARTG